MVVNPEAIQAGMEKITSDFLEADFWPASTSAIKCRIRSAVTQAEAAIASAYPLHR
jgi:hypothetical protein